MYFRQLFVKLVEILWDCNGSKKLFLSHRLLLGLLPEIFVHESARENQLAAGSFVWFDLQESLNHELEVAGVLFRDWVVSAINDFLAECREIGAQERQPERCHFIDHAP
jgi:hypothetical protein